jgi:hypothetical protein
MYYILVSIMKNDFYDHKVYLRIVTLSFVQLSK